MILRQHFLAGMPWTVLPAFAPRGIACHWTAGGPGVAGALATADFLVIGRKRNASYHEIWAWEPPQLHVIQIVDGDRAAHSMNPKPPDWAPLPEVRRILGDRAHDPNAVSYAVSFAGMPPDLAVAMKDPRFVAQAAARTAQLIARYATSLDERPLFNHGWGQPSTRFDAGPLLIPALYLAMAAEATEPEMDPARIIPPALCDLLPGGTVYADVDRRTVLIERAKAASNVGLYGRPPSPTLPDGRAALALVRLDLRGGPSEELVAGYVGDDKVTNVRLVGAPDASAAALVKRMTAAAGHLAAAEKATGTLVDAIADTRDALQGTS